MMIIGFLLKIIVESLCQSPLETHVAVISDAQPVMMKLWRTLDV